MTYDQWVVLLAMMVPCVGGWMVAIILAYRADRDEKTIGEWVVARNNQLTQDQIDDLLSACTQPYYSMSDDEQAFLDEWMHNQ